MVDVAYHLLLGRIAVLADGVDDTFVGLVCADPVDVVQSEMSLLHHFAHSAGHEGNGVLEDELTVLDDIVQTLLDGLGRWRADRTTTSVDKVVVTGTVGMDLGNLDTILLAGLNQGGSTTVAKEGQGGTVGRIGERRTLLGRTDDYFLAISIISCNEFTFGKKFINSL